MKLLLEIDGEKNTRNGECPCAHWDKYYQDSHCSITYEECEGDLQARPGNCPLTEVMGQPCCQDL